jgi:hypothetical protein
MKENTIEFRSCDFVSLCGFQQLELPDGIHAHLQTRADGFEENT